MIKSDKLNGSNPDQIIFSGDYAAVALPFELLDH